MMQTESFQDFNNKLGQRIQDLRVKRGFSQEKLGEMTGMDRVSIGYIEQARRAPRLQSLYAIASALEVSISEFFIDS
jgi:transcriptional regulator with XRE-family HTH domain